MAQPTDPFAAVRQLPGLISYDANTLAQVFRGFRQSVQTPLVEAALLVAMHAHAPQVDKSGFPYILHPVRVMTYAPADEFHQAAALLHDVVEDTPVTLADLRQWGFPEEVVVAVDHLSQRKGSEHYFDYVTRCGANPIAKQVKYADLQDNLDPIRLGGVGAAAPRLRERYQKSRALLDALPSPPAS